MVFRETAVAILAVLFGAAGPQWAMASASSCSLESCEGMNLIDAIKRDLEPWRLRGGIHRKGNPTTR